MNSDERKFVRQVARIQRALAWIAQKSGELGDTRLPGFTQRELYGCERRHAPGRAVVRV